MLRAATLVIAGGLLAAFASQANAQPQKPRAVLELFTSQGCSSCPPADKLAAELATDPNLIVLSMPVDYWDYLGWKDTLASPSLTQRQRAYALERGDRQVYTPQMVVNGATHVVGSDRGRIASATAKSETELALTLDVAANGYKLSVPAQSGKSGTVTLLRVTHSKTVSIGRGENGGAEVTYTNVVRGMIKLGEWNGSAATYAIASADLKPGDADGFVVLLQSGSDAHPGPILAAAKSPGI